MRTCIFSHEGISLRLLDADDLETVQRLRNDFSTWIHLTDPKSVGPGGQKAWLESIGWKNGRMYFAAYDEQNPFLGLVRMDELDPQNRSLRVGLDVLPELRGKGHGTHVYATLEAYAFDYLNTHRLWLLVLESNDHARHLYEKVGFVLEGRQREAIFRGGRYVDYLSMSCLEGDYRKRISL